MAHARAAARAVPIRAAQCPEAEKLTEFCPHLVFSRVVFFSAPLTSLNLRDNNIGGVSSYIKKAEISGSSFKKGATVTYKGSEWIVFQEEDSDGELKLQDLSGICALAAALPR